MINKNKTFTIHDLPKDERPRERLQKFGPEVLSSQELLELVIGRGVPKKSVMSIAQELLIRFGNIKAISEATIEELSKIKGIGLAKAVQLKACFELGKRQELDIDSKEIKIEDIYSILKLIKKSLIDKTKEHFKLILLNTRKKVIGISNISIGTLDSNIVHPREVFKEAILHSAASIILVHNHPSDDPEPSEADLVITKKLIEAGKLLGIPVIDHIIITKKDYFSFKEKEII